MHIRRVWFGVRLQVPGGHEHGSCCGSQGFGLQRCRVTQRATGSPGGAELFLPPRPLLPALLATARFPSV